MCRLLFVKSDEEFSIVEYLERFAQVARSSREFQGHGWGFAYLKNGNWELYRNIKPIWEDDLSQFKDMKATLLLGHARSAFKDEGITIENNMPFQSPDKSKIFIFNGELRGVKIKEQGRIGAEKIFNLILRLGLPKAMKVLDKRTRYIRAANMIVADKNNVELATLFNQDADYFTMHYKKLDNGKGIIVCSDLFINEAGWKTIENNTIISVEDLK